MLINLTIRDVGPGIQLSGSLNTHAADPTPAEIVGLYIATHPEALAQQSWNWYSTQRNTAQRIGG